MILFYKGIGNIYYAVGVLQDLTEESKHKLSWLFGGATLVPDHEISGIYVGPRREMITPWSTNAVEITQNMRIEGIQRIEEFYLHTSEHPHHDPMLQMVYHGLNQDLFNVHKQPDPILYIDDIAAYNVQEGLALSKEEIGYLEEVSEKLGRKLTDSEIFGFSQVNSEHCRHKIFNGTFIIDGKTQPSSLFGLIKLTTKTNLNRVVSAYSDNCAFLKGPVVEIFAPKTQDNPDFFIVREEESIISLKAETHNFPTTVEPFNGAATGTGGEIRDRIGGGKSAFPLAGTAVYMTSYPRLDDDDRKWEKTWDARKWLYHPPGEILIKASNGASDFGNKFGQPLICGSVLTFEYIGQNKKYGYDKVIMLAGGIGYGRNKDSHKDIPEKGEKVVLLGGDNYRIGMGGGAVSSVDTGEYANAIELNAVQRSNPEMQKRVYNAIRAMAEMEDNPVISIHDHGAGGHLNCLSELVEHTGGKIYLDKLPIGDPTLSSKEIIGNESQERMGLVMKEKDIHVLRKVSERERAPFYEVGEIGSDKHFSFESRINGEKPIDLQLEYLFGKPPKTIMEDTCAETKYPELHYDAAEIESYIVQLLQLENVACKDWLTNKADRSVTGKVVKQQTAGKLQLPLNNVAIAALDYAGFTGVATAIGHAPGAGLIDPGIGSVLAIAEALTNIIWAPIEEGLKGVSLSANWMWPCKNKGEDARLYAAVKAASDFALALGINIPTGKDSLSMTQKYPDDDPVLSPGTVIISAAGEVTDYRKTVEPVIVNDPGSCLVYINLSKDSPKLGGSSFSQVINQPGNEAPTVKDPRYFVKAFNLIQEWIKEEIIMSGHDVSGGGFITSILEMTFSDNETGLDINLNEFEEKDLVKILFNENPAVIIQISNSSDHFQRLKRENIDFTIIGKPKAGNEIFINHGDKQLKLDKKYYRDKWFKTSFLLDRMQSVAEKARERFDQYKKQELSFAFPAHFTGRLKDYQIDLRRRTATGIKAAIIREKGVNGDREMAWCMHLAGMDVKDVHMTDLISGRETLEEIHFIVFVGGFSNSDVLGSAKGWAGAFLYNPRAKEALDKFYAREDTLSLGVCNGCQLMVELGLINPLHQHMPRMNINDSKKFESRFLNVDVQKNNSVMLSSLEGSRLGIWVAHTEGKFILPGNESEYYIPLKYSWSEFPGNPNGSDYRAAAICSDDGRHLAMMPHLERALYPANWGYYPADRKNDETSPWIEAYVNARKWIEER